MGLMCGMVSVEDVGKQTVENSPIFVFSASCSIVDDIGFGAYFFGRCAPLLMVIMVASLF